MTPIASVGGPTRDCGALGPRWRAIRFSQSWSIFVVHRKRLTSEINLPGHCQSRESALGHVSDSYVYSRHGDAPQSRPRCFWGHQSFPRVLPDMDLLYVRKFRPHAAGQFQMVTGCLATPSNLLGAALAERKRHGRERRIALFHGALVRCGTDGPYERFG